MKKFMSKMAEFGNLKEGDDGTDVLVDAAAICLIKERPEMWDETKLDGAGGYSELAEELLDMPTVYRVLKVCGQVDLQDPNLIAAATEALGRS